MTPGNSPSATSPHRNLPAMYHSIVCVDDESVNDITDRDIKPHNAFVELSEETREEDEDEHDLYLS